MTDSHTLRRITITLFIIVAAMTLTAETDFQGRLNISKDLGDFDPMAELIGRYEDGEYRFNAIRLGGYYRVIDQLKLGAFYELQSGAIHTEDWDRSQGVWEDTKDRIEQLLILDASPRFQLEFLPGENWLAMIKNRYYINFYNGNQSLMVRPGISYFYIRDREPRFSAGFSYGLYFPLNFDETLLYEESPYLNFIYFLNDRYLLEASLARRSRSWEGKDTHGDDYSFSDTDYLIGLGVIIRL